MYRVGKEEIEAIERVVYSKNLMRINDGYREVDHFEREWSEAIGTYYTLCLSGGTSALIAALAGLEIGPGDEVIVPGYTFMATALAVLAVGAIPVIADIDESLTLDADSVISKISPYTKAIIPVHMCGLPSDMDKLCKIASEYGLKLLEDSCQASGGSYKGKRLGSIGDAGAFSFNHHKILSCGEGGALTTNKREVYERALIYHDGGTAFRPYAKELSVPIFTGVQYRSNEISGAMLRVQLKRLEGILTDLRRYKRRVIDELRGIENIKFIKSNDIEGDCGTTIGFVFENEKKARKFADSLDFYKWLPIDSDRHVYSNWEPILEKRGAYHPSLNPFNMPQNQGRNMEYSKNMCQKTLDILSSTVLMGVNPDWTEEEVIQRIGKLREAAKNL